MHNYKMMTYEQREVGRLAYYDKRWVMPDGVHMEPVEYLLP